jgi:hypothetical protein
MHLLNVTTSVHTMFLSDQTPATVAAATKSVTALPNLPPMHLLLLLMLLLMRLLLPPLLLQGRMGWASPSSTFSN